jgi:glutaredoxin
MKFTFYSKPGCPQCRVLKMKLDAAKIEYTHIEDEDAMIAAGATGAPMLVVNDEKYCGPKAIKFITDWIKENSNGN